MHRFFIDEIIDINNETVTIHKTDDVRHISKVLRVQVGEALEICDGDSLEYVAVVKEISDVILCNQLKKQFIKRESELEIDLYQGIAKGSKMETIIQKSVELGVSKVIPTIMKRSIVKLTDQSEKKKIDRWQKIADEASKQSKRTVIPKIENSIKLSKLKSFDDYDLILVAYEQEKTKKIDHVLKDFHGKRIGIFIGPEGGFEEDEIKHLESLGAKSISLGPRILRTETAGMMLISILQFAIGDV
jgi:16S rRNA (uracil1498-N3)-methyltransferase